MHNEVMKRAMNRFLEGALAVCGSHRGQQKKSLIREVNNDVKKTGSGFREKPFDEPNARELFRNFVWAASRHRNTGFIFGGTFRDSITKTMRYVVTKINDVEYAELKEFLFPDIPLVTNEFLRTKYNIYEDKKKSEPLPKVTVTPKTYVSRTSPLEESYAPDLPSTINIVEGIEVERVRSNRILYRGDTRSPKELFLAGGFEPNILLSADRNNERILQELARHFPARISFTEEFEVAERYMVRAATRQLQAKSYIYSVNVKNMELINLNENLRTGKLGRTLQMTPEQRTAYSERWVNERLIIGNRVPWTAITNVLEYSRNDSRHHEEFYDCQAYDFKREYRHEYLRRYFKLG
ncbi:hypothetical protein AAEX28_09105 [Lentisphaerota bacterium WC36G]|nr:hypothetical protein LJT99_11950 [Lentisphaerae bacterium WC36]